MPWEQLLSKILVTLVVLLLSFGGAYFALRRTWTSEIDLLFFLRKPADAIPIRDRPAEVSHGYGFMADSLDYESGVKVDGVTWQKNFRRTLFTFRNTSPSTALQDGVLEFDLPVSIIAVTIQDQQGCQNLTQAKAFSEAAIPGPSGGAIPLTTYGNRSSITFPRIAPDGYFSLSVVYADLGGHATGSVLLRYNVDKIAKAERKLIVAEGQLPRSLRIDFDAPEPTEGRMSISFGPPQKH